MLFRQDVEGELLYSCGKVLLVPPQILSNFVEIVAVKVGGNGVDSTTVVGLYYNWTGLVANKDYILARVHLFELF